jgi:integrase
VVSRRSVRYGSLLYAAAVHSVRSWSQIDVRITPWSWPPHRRRPNRRQAGHDIHSGLASSTGARSCGRLWSAMPGTVPILQRLPHPMAGHKRRSRRHRQLAQIETPARPGVIARPTPSAEGWFSPHLDRRTREDQPQGTRGDSVHNMWRTPEILWIIPRLLWTVPDRYWALVALAGGTGLRWENAQDSVGTRSTQPPESSGRSGWPKRCPDTSSSKPYPKSRAGRRTVPLPPFVPELLVDHARRFPPAESGYAFTARTGEPLKRGAFRARIRKPSLQRAALSPMLRFHDLRHSYATWLVSDGVPINDVAKVMGHEQTSTTLNRYTHSTSERDRRILASFAAFSLPLIIAAGSENEEDPSEEGS